MVQELKVEPSEDLAYWVGVAQSDGCLTKYTIKRSDSGKKGTVVQVRLHVSSKSLCMAQKFKELSEKIFLRTVKIHKRPKPLDAWDFKMGAKRLLPLFRKLDILISPMFIPPIWVIQEPKYFGSYLAGLIDGDGCVIVKRPKYPQCAVALYSGSIQDVLKKSIIKTLGCSVFQRYQTRVSELGGKTIRGSWYTLDFYISSKTAEFAFDRIIPHLQLKHKKKKLEDFILRRHPSTVEN